MNATKWDARTPADSDADARAREYYAARDAGAAERREALERDGGEIPAVNLQPIMQPTRPPGVPSGEPAPRTPNARQAKHQAKDASQARRATVAAIRGSQAQPAPQLSDLDRAVEALVRQHSSGAVIDAAWEAASRIFHRRRGKLQKHARPRLSPRSGRRIERRWQRRKLRDLARRILARHYPVPSQECPF